MSKTIFRTFNILFFYGLVILFFLLTGKVNASTIIVPPPPASIQNAINIAANGDTIKLSAGTYIEEVQVISKNLNIVGAGRDVTIIKAPGPSTHLSQFFNFGFNIYCIVMIDNRAAPTPQTVNISNLTVDGDSQQETPIPPGYSSSNRFYAIGYHNAGGNVQNVHTTNTRSTNPLLIGALAGGGIFNASDIGAVNFNVVNCLIDFYQRMGMDLRGSALTASVTGTTINRGYLLQAGTQAATPNGMQFSNSTKGNITNNIITGNIATLIDSDGSGIISLGAGPNLLITGNIIVNNDIGIASLTSLGNLTISNNFISAPTPGINNGIGIYIDNTNGLTTLDSNTLDNVPNVGINLLSQTNQPFILRNNEFNGGQTGLLVQGNLASSFLFTRVNPEDPFISPIPTNSSEGPVVRMDSDLFNGTLGFYIQENGAPNDIWSSTATVSFDGLISGEMSVFQFLSVITKIFDNHEDPNLGLVLDFIPPIPVVTDVIPSFGPDVGGNPVIITGSHFFPGSIVNFGSTPASNVVIVSSSVIIATAPPGTGTVEITVTTANGTSITTPFDVYAYITIPPGSPPPTITRLSPNSGPTSGGTAVNIIGAGFLTGDTKVFFGLTPATRFFVHSFSSLTAIAPPGTGVVDVIVRTSMGSSSITPIDQFTYTSLPPLPPASLPAPLPPARFRGVIKKNEFLNKTENVFHVKWIASPSPNIVLYRIFDNGKLIKTVPADLHLVFKKRLDSKFATKNLRIAAVDSNNVESNRIRIRITHE